MKPADKKQGQQPRPDVEVGDHLYVSHRGNHCAGHVVAHGQHGVTVKIGGAHQKIPWEGVLGHKKRAAKRYNIVDQGEDGMLVDDGKGRRRFIAIGNEAKDDQMITKSMRPVLFLKSANVGDPSSRGLQKKQVTDKNGVQTTKWVRNEQGAAPSQPGQHVGFENGEHKGHGEVVASGQHGVTVRDGSGGEHRVLHERVTHQWQGEGKPDGSPHEQAQATAPAKHGAAPAPAPVRLFADEDIAKLPDKVNQPVKSWDELVEKGTEGLAQFREQLGKVAQAMGLQSGKKPDEITPDEWENDQGFMFLAPLKGEKRAREKVESDYGGDWSQLRDVVRATISVPSMSSVIEALGHIKSAGIELAQKPKDRFSKPTDEGYRDLMTIVKLPNGMLAELQIHVKAMTLAKESGHKDYETTRSLVAKYGEPPSDKWDEADKQKFEAAVQAQRDLYDTVWTKASAGGGGTTTKPGDGSEKPMQKAIGSSKMIMLIRRS